MLSSTARSVPIIDLSPFTLGGRIESRAQTAKELSEALRSNGCVGFSGHGVAPEKLAKAFQMTKLLFDLPESEKMKAPHPDGMVPHRGYSGIGREKGAAKTASETDDEEQKDAYLNVSDLKESYEVGSEENAVQYNIWLPEDVFPGFRHFMTSFFWELQKPATVVLEALMMSLNLTEAEAAEVRALHTGHDDQLRLLHYPAISKEMLENPAIGRLGTHTDWSLFTLLFQDTQSGLEFQDRESGDFMSATPKEGIVYMNLGDSFQRIANNLYPSAFHRVSISGKDTRTATPDRYSIPYFVVPLSDGLLRPQPSLVAAAGGKQVFEAMTFEQYSQKMFELTQLRE